MEQKQHNLCKRSQGFRAARRGLESDKKSATRDLGLHALGRRAPGNRQDGHAAIVRAFRPAVAERVPLLLPTTATAKSKRPPEMLAELLGIALCFSGALRVFTPATVARNPVPWRRAAAKC
jgi:hypothetical protein